MLTLSTSFLNLNSETPVYVLEWDLEYGQVQTFGLTNVYYNSGGPEIESGATGGCYSDPQVLADVQFWIVEQHILAVFEDEAKMRLGAVNLAKALGDMLPAGIHNALERDK